ncbi:hypothetical protein [Streptomyces sp. NPDC020742]|uniref:SCO0607 family lipoprotein n=1 Tax=unclassified Streptomyces TaxID=2593676 RepID=UPI0033EC913E
MHHTSRPRSSSAAGGRRRPGGRRTAVLAIAAVTVALSATGCSTEDAKCRGGEYPVLAIGSSTGGACVPNGKKPPKGFTRYPAGKVPEHVGDKWDTYWETHTVDKSGKIITTHHN